MSNQATSINSIRFCNGAISKCNLNEGVDYKKGPSKRLAVYCKASSDESDRIIVKDERSHLNSLLDKHKDSKLSKLMFVSTGWLSRIVSSMRAAG
jgi:hypothetical protein